MQDLPVPNRTYHSGTAVFLLASLRRSFDRIFPYLQYRKYKSNYLLLLKLAEGWLLAVVPAVAVPWQTNSVHL